MADNQKKRGKQPLYLRVKSELLADLRHAAAINNVTIISIIENCLAAKLDEMKKESAS